MSLAPGSVLIERSESEDGSAWFILHADPEGILAFDLTRTHPRIFYRSFEAVLNFEDTKPVTEKVVLLGGPERPDDALVILHETRASGADSHPINDDFAFLSYNYVLLPGKPPAITTPDNRPSEIKLKQTSGFLVAMGYRVFDTVKMGRELNAGNWVCMPASASLVFNTTRHDRRAKFLKLIN
jgi:putative AlgH/UPF0301 family transcriptional regulator